ncbi:hypothetical protein LTR37_014052 [Vermiconidia calcicola]|uniref:Uncharacterized protein n=1 Tax=Vermiconidia calcicola TaxID=1690605 RepID=A0ACC3MUX6_9PEZI|nr:hypothetical protein LTR37_014052 [Vermiconidia calcicola]
MFDEDGIEVYLKPVGQDDEPKRIAELETDTGVMNFHKSHFLVDLFRNDIKVVVKFLDEFNMYNSTAVLVVVAFGAGQKRKDPDSFHILQKPMVKGQQCVIQHGPWKNFVIAPAADNKTTVPYMDEDDDYNCHANPGTVTVFLRRGNPKWEDGCKSRAWPGDPCKIRSFKPGSFKPLSGKSKNDKTYIFEFCPRTADLIKKYAIDSGPVSNVALQTSNETIQRRFAPKRRLKQLALSREIVQLKQEDREYEKQELDLEIENLCKKRARRA